MRYDSEREERETREMTDNGIVEGILDQEKEVEEHWL